VVIHKVVNGPVADAPAGGWVFTISSACAIFPGTSDTVTIPAAGGTASSGPLFSTTTVGGTQCVYSIAETAAPGWTTDYNPASGKVSLGTATTGGPTVNDAAITITNTHPQPSSSVVTSSAAPTTPTASASPTNVLANTGSKTVKPATYVGIALVVLGAALLLVGRRSRRAEH
jgi:LPXTG-motif cell wall-anchored protein